MNAAKPQRGEVAEAIAAHDWGKASRLADAQCAPVTIKIEPDTTQCGAAAWEATSPTMCRLLVSDAIADIHNGLRIETCLPLIAGYHGSPEFRGGRTRLSPGDLGISPGLAFCAVTPDYTLIPDAAFLDTLAYRDVRAAYAASPVPWGMRRRVAFWRGATTGILNSTGWRGLQRIRLCQIAAAEQELFDVGLSNIVQITDPTSIEEINASGLIKGHVPVQTSQEYRYHIDIDGNTNSWPGLFQKLLTGSPVLKIESRLGFRQWYYHRLKPWVNFVPVASEMADLAPKVRWLMQHDDVAREIGERGRELAESMTYQSEIEASFSMIAEAMAPGAARRMQSPMAPLVTRRPHRIDPHTRPPRIHSGIDDSDGYHWRDTVSAIAHRS